MKLSFFKTLNETFDTLMPSGFEPIIPLAKRDLAIDPGEMGEDYIEEPPAEGYSFQKVPVEQLLVKIGLPYGANVDDSLFYVDLIYPLGDNGGRKETHEFAAEYPSLIKILKKAIIADHEGKVPPKGFKGKHFADHHQFHNELVKYIQTWPITIF
jgi:hypothetical protein